MYSNQVGFTLDMQCRVSSQNSISVPHQVNWVKKKSHTILSADAEKHPTKSNRHSGQNF